MNQRLALALAAGMTVFVVVLAIGLMNYVNGVSAPAPDAPATATVAAGATTSPTAPAIDPTVEAVLREREAAYRAALEDANARLSQANEEIRRANDAVTQAERDQDRMAVQVGTLVDERDAAIAEADAAVIRAEQQPIAPAPAPAPPAPIATAAPAWIPAEQALAAISALAPAGRLQAPAELVRYEGTPAWELRLDVGCGAGHMVCELAAEVGPTGHITGIDASPDAVAACVARAARDGFSQRIDIRQCDAAVLAEVRARGLVYLEDATVNLSVSPKVVEQVRLPMQRAQMVIDAEPTAPAIAEALQRLEQEAIRNGSAIATGSGLEVTIETVAEWAKTLQEKGILLVPLSAAYKGRAT